VSIFASIQDIQTLISAPSAFWQRLITPGRRAFSGIILAITSLGTLPLRIKITFVPENILTGQQERGGSSELCFAGGGDLSLFWDNEVEGSHLWPLLFNAPVNASPEFSGKDVRPLSIKLRKLIHSQNDGHQTTGGFFLSGFLWINSPRGKPQPFPVI
jgi:hypothetical protein